MLLRRLLPVAVGHGPTPFYYYLPCASCEAKARTDTRRWASGRQAGRASAAAAADEAGRASAAAQLATVKPTLPRVAHCQTLTLALPTWPPEAEAAEVSDGRPRPT